MSDFENCSSEPLLELVKECDAEDSIINFQVKSTVKKIQGFLNGPTQIHFDKCSMSDSLRLKRCIRIAPNFIR